VEPYERVLDEIEGDLRRTGEEGAEPNEGGKILFVELDELDPASGGSAPGLDGTSAVDASGLWGVVRRTRVRRHGGGCLVHRN